MDRPIKKKTWTWPRLTGGILALVLIPLTLHAVLDDLTRTSLKIETEKLTISTVERGTFEEYIAITGDVLPYRIFFLTAEEGGRVEEVIKKEGNLVEQGEPILRLANTDLELEILRREDRLREQRNLLFNTRVQMEQQSRDADREMAELDYRILRQKRIHERNAILVEEALISELDYELSRDEYEFFLKQKRFAIEKEKEDEIFRQTQIEQLEQSVEGMEDNLELAKKKLERLLVTAPSSGQLTALDAEIGQSKTPGERLGRIDGVDGFKVRAKVDQLYISRVEVARRAETDLSGKTYALRVVQVYPKVDQGRFEIELEFSGEVPPKLKRGQTLHVRLELGEASEALLVEKGTFFQKTGGRWIFVIAPSGEYATKREIRLGRENPDYFEVLSGLEPGQRVITSSYDVLEDFDRIVLQP